MFQTGNLTSPKILATRLNIAALFIDEDTAAEAATEHRQVPAAKLRVLGPR
jgi:hypothetical protein